MTGMGKKRTSRNLTKPGSVRSVTGFSWSAVDLLSLDHSQDLLYLDETLSQLEIPFAAPEGLKNVFLSLQCGSSRSINPKGGILTLIPAVSLDCSARESNLHFRQKHGA